MNKRISAIDIFRIAAAVMVIAIHTYPLADLNETAEFIVTNVLCRVAVPFFFMASGAFLITEYAKNADKLLEFVKKTAVIYLIAIAMYIPVNIYSGYFTAEKLLPEIFKDIIFDGTVYHLWYLPASVMGACISWLLVRRLGFEKALAVTAVLYVFGLLGDSYYGITVKSAVLKAAYNAMFQVFDYSRNGIFFAPLFFTMGGYVREKNQISKAKDILLFTLFLALMTAEALVLHLFEIQRHQSMYAFLAPCVYFLLKTLMVCGGETAKPVRRAALIIYLVHPMVIVALRLFAKLASLEDLLVENNPVHFAAVAAGSVIFAAIYVRVIKPKTNIKPLRAWRETDLDAIRHNARVLRDACGKGRELMAVVKADAYGHGAFEVSRCLEKEGIKAFAVAAADEGISLRKSGIKGDILVLGYTPPERAWELKKYRLTQTVTDTQYAELLNGYGKKINVHIKIDTGMHRLGIDWYDISAVRRCMAMKNLCVTGVFTHFCVSDSFDNEDVMFTRLQAKRFLQLTENCGLTGNRIKRHLQSSSGLLNYGDINGDFARVGIALYGVYSSEKERPAYSALKPAMSVKSKIVQVKTVKAGEGAGYGRAFAAEKDSRLATVSIGYADGIPRSLSGKGYVLINGQRAKIAGRICMDQLSADVTDISDVKVGDEAVLIGGELTAEETAGYAGTITNELLSRMGERLEVIYIGK